MCSPHVSECVSKVPHSFIMSSKCEEQKSRDEQKKKKMEKAKMKERWKGNNRSRKSFYGFTAGDIVCLSFSFPLPTLVLCYCCLSGRHEAR